MNKIFLTECSNYLGKYKSPFFLIGSLASLANSCLWAVTRRVFPNLIRVVGMPSEIFWRRYRFLSSQKHMIKSWKFRFSKIHTPSVITLSYGKYSISNNSDWNLKTLDPEISDSLHRWGWLLRGITDADERITLEQGLGLIRSWLGCYSMQKFSANDPYSASERILNASIFFRYYGCDSLPNDICASFRMMTYQIAKNLEFFEGERTGNHALNNARGLFVGGLMVKNAFAVDLAYSIFIERLPKLVTADGFLRESSTHYHFLFTRWVLEIYWFACLYNKEEISDFIFPYAKKLVERCWFFLVHNQSNDSWTFPLVGDISPDFPPEWLVSLPWSELAQKVYRPHKILRFKGDDGWASIFGMRIGRHPYLVCDYLSFPESFWHRIELGESVLFIYAKASDGIVRAGHEHMDLGSFVLYRHGLVVLADCGRVDYTNSELSDYGKSAFSHNTIFIDGLPPTVEPLSFFVKSYKKVAVKIKLRKFKSGIVFSLKHDGFKRIGDGDVKHHRKIILTNSGLIIKDEFECLKHHHLMMRFHVNSEVVYSESGDNSLRIISPPATFLADNRLIYRNPKNNSAGEHANIISFNYGSFQQCSTIELACRINRSIAMINKLDWH